MYLCKEKELYVLYFFKVNLTIIKKKGKKDGHAWPRDREEHDGPIKHWATVAWSFYKTKNKTSISVMI
jgi:hypothetical protein